MRKSIKQPKPQTRAAARPTQPDPARWSVVNSPLKISYWYGHPGAPQDIQEAVRKEPELSHQELCTFLPWRDALTILVRTDVRLFHFHPTDYDWQVYGWQLAESGIIDGPFGPIVGGLLSDAECRDLTRLPANPTTDDFAAEVMQDYSTHIDRMEFRVPELYKTLQFGLESWIQPAVLTLEQVVTTNHLHRIVKFDGLRLFKRAYQIAATGSSQIDPLEEVKCLSPEQVSQVLKCSDIGSTEIQ